MHGCRSFLAIVALAACSLTGLACSDDVGRPGNEPSSPYKAPTSPENVLFNLRAAYAERDVVELDSLLAEDFVFQLSVEDAGQPGMPDAWNRADELLCHAGMFDSTFVSQLVLDFAIGEAVFDSTAQLWAVLVSNVDIYLYGSTPDFPVPQTYTVSDNTSAFWFRQNAWTAPGTAQKVWTIVTWQDSPIEGPWRTAPRLPPAEPESWGTLKAIFR